MSGRGTNATIIIWETLLLLLVTPSFADAALSQQCQINASSAAHVGAQCTEDPSCVIVGDTHMLEWKSPEPAKIIVVCLHGLGLCAKAYKPLAKELSAAGIGGFGVNVRGFGPDRDKPDRGKLNCAETVRDVSKLLANIRHEYPDYKVFLIGESMGGALAIRIAAEDPELVNGIVCSAPAWKLLKKRRTTVKGIFELILFPGSYPGPAGRGIMHQATSDPELTQHWMTDSSHKLKLTLKEATTFLNFISKTESYAKQLTTPVLVVQGLDDRLVSPKAVATLVREIPSNNKTFLIDGKGEHLVLEEGRFSRPVVEKLISWLKMDTQSGRTVTEALNDQELSSREKRRLQTLRRLAQEKRQRKF
ncbi:MAG: alpha/beta fold hydrolase [Cyanobacteria bacterium SZAS-4]|nr:alpha/beta fold hydrolase [Cyanobacteria bacterium SZAS-4]